MDLPVESQLRGHIRVRGQVQGVGFRPFVHRLAAELGLAGWVRNDGEGVEIEAQGPQPALAALLERLVREAPPLARVDAVEAEYGAADEAATGFRIDASGGGPAATAIAPDSAVCGDCLAELFDPANRRWRYPFINCTHCGPRYTITARLPYDRPHTSMARFAMCPACLAEYEAPADRRFHAQPNACPDCGPRLALLDGYGQPLAVADPIAEALARLVRGEIVAVRGLGGFHLMCDATDAAAVVRLRARKNREEKPFALMVAGLASVDRWAVAGEAQRALLASGERPVVLLPRARGREAAPAGVAPGMPGLGVMLPYTPLHYLLFHEAAGRPAGTAWLGESQWLTLVATSANPAGEPLVTRNDEALARLAGIADCYLVHDRDILVRCDDSVVRPLADGGMQFVRRARGWTPRAIRLAGEGPPVLACGGWYKNTVCVTRGAEAFLSQHVGELDNAATCAAMEEAAAHLTAVLQVEPQRVAHDLHPDFFSSRFARAFAAARGIPALAVQHHHAHIAAVMAEHGIEEAVLGLALDGVGLGSDGGLWGGELLRVEGARCERIGCLAPLALPGGDRAAQEPWRMAASALFALGRGEEILTRFRQPAAAPVLEMLRGGVNCPATSSAGRLFDAAAGLLGVRDRMAFEGQAAMLLEGLAAAHGPAAPMRDGWRIAADGRLDFLPLLARLAEGMERAAGAALFHATLAAGLAQWVEAAAGARGLRRVAMGGGCLLNAILSRSLRERLEAAGMTVYEARQAPPNDGGLALGQAWVALHSTGSE